MKIEGLNSLPEYEVKQPQAKETGKAQAPKKEENNEEKINNAIKKINDNEDVKNNGIKFEKDDATSKWVVKVYNENTGEVIRQIPTKEFLEIAKSIEAAMGNMGNIFNREV